MTLVLILVCVLPVGFILLAFAVIAAVGMKIYRTGKLAYEDLKPYVGDLKDKGMNAQKRGLDFAERGNRIGQTFQEIAGRWAFVSEIRKEASTSPVIRLAELAGRFSGDKNR